PVTSRSGARSPSPAATPAKDQTVAKNEERRRVLDLLASGHINVEQATLLLKALGPSTAEAMSSGPVASESQAAAAWQRAPEPPPPPPPPRRGGPRFLKIKIVSDDQSGTGDVNVSVPYALAKFALRFLPNEARSRLDDQGIDLAALFESANDELPDGKLIDITTDQSDGSGRSHITIEVI